MSKTRKPTPEGLQSSIAAHEVHQDALRVKLRSEILRALLKLLPQAKSRAQKGKPALLRLIVRHCLRGGVLDVNPQGTQVRGGQGGPGQPEPQRPRSAAGKRPRTTHQKFAN